MQAKFNYLLLFLFFHNVAIGQRPIDTLKHPLLDTMMAKVQKADYPNIHSILVQYNDRLVFEEYFGNHTADSLQDIRSVFKSITSLLTGIAMDKEIIANLDAPVWQYFPDHTPKDARKENISLRHLLQMKSGFEVEEFYGIGPAVEDLMWDTDDWIQYTLDLPMKDDPGKNFSYSASEPLLLGAALTKAANQSIMDFSREYLFEPMGITDYRWTITPKGFGMTAGSFFMKPRDMIKLGQLVLEEGEWKALRYISAPWITTSTRCNDPIDYSFVRYSRMDNAQVETARYGYYWYKERLRYGSIDTDVLFASGNGGQYIMILKDLDAVVVFTGGNYGNWRGKLPFEILLKYIIPALQAI